MVRSRLWIAKEAGASFPTQRLQAKESGLKFEERTFCAENNRHPTLAEQKHLNRQENHLSTGIYNQKHDPQTQSKISPALFDPLM